MKNKIITALFCLLLSGGFFAELILPDRDYSVQERRSLAQLPACSTDDIRSGAFGNGLEEYLSDQFPVRDAWISVKTCAERLCGKKECGGVYFAENEYLIEKHSELPDDQMQRNLGAVRSLSERIGEIPLYFMPVPTASYILSDLLPAYAPNADQSAAVKVAEALGIQTVDVKDALLMHKDEYIYYKTDHHWTSLGAYYAYAEWKAQKGETALPLAEWKTEILCSDFRGTTYAKVNDPFAAYDVLTAYYLSPHTVSYNQGSYQTESLYERAKLDGPDKYAVFLNSNQADTVIYGQGKGKLLILKDSYANTFAQFPAEDYAETHLIDMRFFRKSIPAYIEENGITEVLVLYNTPNFCEDTDISRCAK